MKYARTGQTPRIALSYRQICEQSGPLVRTREPFAHLPEHIGAAGPGLVQHKHGEPLPLPRLGLAGDQLGIPSGIDVVPRRRARPARR